MQAVDFRAGQNFGESHLTLAGYGYVESLWTVSTCVCRSNVGEIGDRRYLARKGWFEGWPRLKCGSFPTLYSNSRERSGEFLSVLVLFFHNLSHVIRAEETAPRVLRIGAVASTKQAGGPVPPQPVFLIFRTGHA